MFVDRFYPPEEPSRYYMDKQEQYEDARYDYRKLKNMLDNELDDESQRTVLEEKLMDMYMTVQDLLLELEELS
jgi:hypothetical protein